MQADKRRHHPYEMKLTKSSPSLFNIFDTYFNLTFCVFKDKINPLRLKPFPEKCKK